MRKYCESCDTITDQKLLSKTERYGTVYKETICTECLHINGVYLINYMTHLCENCWWKADDELFVDAPSGRELQSYISDFVEFPIYSMDCMNAYEWTYTIECPHCGKSWEESDSNC